VHPVSFGMSELRYTRRVYRDHRGSDGSDELVVSGVYRRTRGEFTRVGILQSLGLVQQLAMHHRYEANHQFLSRGVVGHMTYSIDLVLPVLVYSESSIDTPHTTSPIPIGRLGRMRWYVGNDLGVKVIQDLTIGKPDKVSSQNLESQLPCSRWLAMLTY